MSKFTELLSDIQLDLEIWLIGGRQPHFAPTILLISALAASCSQILILKIIFYCRLMSDYEVTLVNDNMQGIPDDRRVKNTAAMVA